jgi:tRNA-dihydrouridine synthase B
MQLILAPLHGFTDALFRNTYFRHFGGVDVAIAPFISLTHGDKITTAKVRDVLPASNQFKQVIPQILGNNARDFVMLCHFLANELGYTEVNWNLGCPIQSIVRKKRGSGMLPYPEIIDRLLGEIIPSISMEISIKLRLGLKSADEFPLVAEVLNRYPLKNVTIHPRLGIQQYEGDVLLDKFAGILPLIRHKVIYNGDIHRFDDYLAIRKRFPMIDDFMLGRGVLYNPFLPEIIKAGITELPSDAGKRFIAFYLDLEESEKVYRKYWMSKMKEYWKYFSSLMGLDEEAALRVLRCTSEKEWERIISVILNSIRI